MRSGYYPWKVEKLVDWLDDERTKYGNSKMLAEALGVPVDILRAWTVRKLPFLTLATLKSLASYRQCSLREISDWLEVTPGHLNFLVQSVDDSLI